MWLNIIFGWLIPPLKMASRTNIESVTSYNTISNQKVQEVLGYDFIPVQESVDFHLNNYINDQKLNQL